MIPCAQPGCGKEKELWWLTENEKGWLCPCCDGGPDSHGRPSCEHNREDDRRRAVRKIIAHAKTLDERSRAEIVEAIATPPPAASTPAASPRVEPKG